MPKILRGYLSGRFRPGFRVSEEREGRLPAFRTGKAVRFSLLIAFRPHDGFRGRLSAHNQHAGRRNEEWGISGVTVLTPEDVAKGGGLEIKDNKIERITREKPRTALTLEIENGVLTRDS